MYSNVGLESPRPKPSMTPPPPFGKKKPEMDAAPPPDADMPPDAPDMDSDDQGGDLCSSMIQPMMDAGMDEPAAKTALAGALKALVASLEGGGSTNTGTMPPEMGDMGNDGV